MKSVKLVPNTFYRALQIITITFAILILFSTFFVIGTMAATTSQKEVYDTKETSIIVQDTTDKKEEDIEIELNIDNQKRQATFSIQ